MNERIKQILKQCSCTDKPWPLVDTDKFASLLIKECIDTILDSSVEYATRPQIAQELKEHFGVE